jgi:bifunctional non-homologous end joining protein LigD
MRRKTDVIFTNLEKVFFPATGFTKGDLIRYYIDVAPVLVPHFRERPVTLIRMPDGVRGERFYEKNAPGWAPDWVPTTIVPKGEGGEIRYIMINDPRTLAWCANNAAIEMHPFLHRAQALSRPTHIAFDLDPGEGADLLTCIEVGFLVRDVLEHLGLEAFPKVSGSKGLQLYVPLNTPVTYDSVTPFAKAIAELLQQRHPDLIVSNMSKALRTDKVFIDWSQNHQKKTTVGPYSVRGKRDEPFVSLPVTWAELTRAQKAGKVERLYFSPPRHWNASKSSATCSHRFSKRGSDCRRSLCRKRQSNEERGCRDHSSVMLRKGISGKPPNRRRPFRLGARRVRAVAS